MANIFEAVKEAVPVPLAAERYGLQANRTGWCAARSTTITHPA